MFVTMLRYRVRSGSIDALGQRVDRDLAEGLADFDVERMGVVGGGVMVSRAIADMLEPAHH